MLLGFSPARQAYWLAFVAACSAVFIGCSGPADPNKDKPCYPVVGKITVQGKTLPYARIALHPDAEKGNTTAEEPRARVDADGVYRLQTGEVEGARAGWYRVAIFAIREPGPGFPLGPPVWLANQKYADPNQSGLEIEVKAAPQPGTYDFDLQP